MTVERSSLQDIVTQELARLLRIEESSISGTARLAEDLGVDSMNVADLVVAIEGRTGLRIAEGREADVADSRTVDELVRRLTKVLR